MKSETGGLSIGITQEMNGWRDVWSSHGRPLVTRLTRRKRVNLRIGVAARVVVVVGAAAVIGVCLVLTRPLYLLVVRATAVMGRGTAKTVHAVARSGSVATTSVAARSRTGFRVVGALRLPVVRPGRTAIARAAVVVLVVGGPAVAIAAVPGVSGPLRCGVSSVTTPSRAVDCQQAGSSARRRVEVGVPSLSVLLEALGFVPVAVVAAPNGGVTVTAAPVGSAPAAATTVAGGTVADGSTTATSGSEPPGYGASGAESVTGQAGPVSGPESPAQDGPESARADAVGVQDGNDLSFTVSAFKGVGASVSVTTDGDITVTPGFGNALAVSAGEVPSNPTESSVGLQGLLSVLGFNGAGSLRAYSDRVTGRVTVTRDLPGGLAAGYGLDFTLDGDGLTITQTPDGDLGVASLAKGWAKDLGWVNPDSWFSGYIGPSFTLAREDRDDIFGAVFGREGPPVEESDFIDRDRAWAERLKPYEGPVFEDPAPLTEEPNAEEPFTEDPFTDEPFTEDPNAQDPLADPLADDPSVDVEGFDTGEPTGWAEGDPGDFADSDDPADAAYADDSDSDSDSDDADSDAAGYGDDGYGDDGAGDSEDAGYGDSEGAGYGDSEGTGFGDTGGSDSYGGSGDSSSSDSSSSDSSSSSSPSGGGFSTSSTGDGGF